ncbi:hypothetical protein JHK82_050059 [Glycine max]|nr:hypothetical protein JHK82_050059 [Glycine max]
MPPPPPAPPLLALLLSFINWIATAKIPLPRPIASVSPCKTLTALSLLSSPIEVEVNLRLADANTHRHITTLLSPFHIITHRQQNLFFGGVASELSVRHAILHLRFYSDDKRCVASLKARAVLVDGVSRMKEDPCRPPPEREKVRKEREKEKEKSENKRKKKRKVRIRERNKGLSSPPAWTSVAQATFVKLFKVDMLSVLQARAPLQLLPVTEESVSSLNGCDSGGSIQQLLMDWEVISISGSSSEDTRCGASDNESSSSESHNVGSPSSPPAIAGYEWVRDNVLKYKSSLTSMASVLALQCYVKLENPKDSCKMVVQACTKCALLEHLSVAPSQLQPNNWAMVQAFEILCPFFNIRPSVSVFLFFFQMKLIGQIGRVSLNSMSKKLFEFDSNVFPRFKDRFFKVLAIDAMVDGLPLMFNRDREPYFPFYWQSDLTKFKSLDEDLLTLVERIDKFILELLPSFLEVRAIFISFLGIMGNLSWRPLVKQVGPVSGILPPSVVAPAAREERQTTSKVDPVSVVAKVTPNALTSILAKRKQDDSARPFGHKKSRSPMSLSVLRQICLWPSGVEASGPTIVVAATLAPPPLLVVLVQEVTPIARVDALVTSTGSIAASTSTIATPLLSAYVVTTSASMMLPISSSTPPIPSFVVLATMLPSSSSRPHVSLDHLYTSNDANSLWGSNYKLE